MRVTITGGAGFLGRKVAGRLATMGKLGKRDITAMTLFDVAEPKPPAGAAFPVACLTGDIADPADAARLVDAGTGVVIHLAAVVSAQAEADFDLGWHVNLDGTRTLLEACRASGAKPRVVFTSSVATFSGGQEAVIDEATRPVPGNSYGAQKAAGELLIHDYSRKGYIDGVSLRLPTVVVRPGRPNRAASSFASSILREPFLGEEAFLPVPESFALWIASPRAATDWLIHAATLDGKALGLDRGINPPGLTVTVRDMMEVLQSVGGHAAMRLVSRVEDKEVEAIVGTWPARFRDARAKALGFRAHEGLEALVRAFLEDDLAETKALRG
ncbi:D-erythronate dehydrogenase [Elioraea rosea]|uniref:D-erythronate dehydrogenase n=1 Tax=Elioraea rosea TaxID=2492390 RepID=UPI0011843BDA|nr:D-erythronate dehydrogenase [Elioraea rosea]